MSALVGVLLMVAWPPGVLCVQDLDPVLGCRLKRVILIGDHHQLPPVVKSMAFQKYSKLDQSLFTRFVRLGTPTVQVPRARFFTGGGGTGNPARCCVVCLP